MSNQSVKRIISSLSGILPIERMRLPKRHHFILPFWHAVSDVPLPHLSKLFRAPTTSEFERTLDFLLMNFRPASIEDVGRLSSSKGRNEKRLFFPSFDDGLTPCYEIIAPILKRKGIQAAFFINPLFVDNKTLFHRHKASLLLNALDKEKLKTSEFKEAKTLLQNRFNNQSLNDFLRHTVFTDHWLLDQMAQLFKIDFDHFMRNEHPYMTRKQVLELQNDGFLIGAHGMDHREFYLSSEQEIMGQISSSMDYLIQDINPPLRTFAFPYTDFEVSDAVFEKANGEKLWDLSFGTAGIKDEPMRNHLQRIPMESSEWLDGKRVIRTEYLWYYMKSVFGKNKVRRQ